MDYIFTTAKTKEDFHKIADLIGKTFSRKPYWFFYDMRMGIATKDPLYKPEHSQIAIYNGEIVSHVGIVKKYMNLEGEIFKVGGIADVATHREHLGKGLAKKLMYQAIEYMKNSDYDITILSGIPNYYHKFGYIECMNRYEVLVPTKNLKDVNTKYHIEKYEEKYKREITAIYNENYKNINGSIVRDKDYYYRTHLDKETIIVKDENGNIRGYAIYWDIYRPYFLLKEAGIMDFEAFKAIISYTYKRLIEENLKELTILMAPNTPFVELIKDFHAEIKITVNKEKEGGKMGRFIKFYSIFKKLEKVYENRIKNSFLKNSDLKIQIKTELGIVNFFYNNKSLQINNSEKFLPDEVLECSQDSIFRFFMGFWNTERFMLREGIKLSQKMRDFLSVVFPEKITHFSEVDYF